MPRRISYDNSATAVIEVLSGRQRKLTKQFLRLQGRIYSRSTSAWSVGPTRRGTSSGCWARPDASSRCRCHRSTRSSCSIGNFLSAASPVSNRRRVATKSYIRVLRLFDGFSLQQLTKVVEYALAIDVIDTDSIRTILEHRAERPVALFSLGGRPHLAHLGVETTEGRRRA